MSFDVVFQVKMTRNLRERLRKLAHELDHSEGEVVRRAITEYVNMFELPDIATIPTAYDFM